MNKISKEIYVTQKRLEVYIDVTCGTDLVPITLNVIDYEIPEETTATVYSIGKENKLKKQICTISENAISFTPQKGFFEVGSNLLQVRMTYQNKDLISFKIMVIGHKSIVSDDAEEVKNNQSLMQQILSEMGVLSARLNEALKIPEGSTTGDAALNDIKVGYNGTVYDSPGDAVREQVGELKSDFNELNATHINWLNPRYALDGYMYDDTGTLKENSGYFAYNYKIPVKCGDTVRHSGTGNNSYYAVFIIFNKNGTKVQKITFSRGEFTITAEDASYMRYYAPNNAESIDYYLNNRMIVINRELPTKYIDFSVIDMETYQSTQNAKDITKIREDYDNFELLNISEYGNMEYTKKTGSLWSEVELSVTGDGSKRYLYTGLDLISTNSVSFKNGDWIAGEKYYVGGMVKVNKECEGLFCRPGNIINDSISIAIENPNIDEWYHLGATGVFVNATYNLFGAIFADNESQNNATLYYKCAMIVNLTRMFGAGNEPTAKQMEDILSRYENYYFQASKPVFNGDILKTIFSAITKKSVESKNGNIVESEFGINDKGSFYSVSPINPGWSGWLNGRYNYGERPNTVPIYNEFNGSVKTDGMFVSDGKHGAWTTQGSGENTYGGHVIHGWNEIGTFRLSAMIGNTRVGGIPREDEAALLVYSPSDCFNNPNQELTEWQAEHRMIPNNRDYYGGNPKLLLGRIRIGSDLNREGLLVERRRSTQFGDFIVSDGTHYRKLVFNSDGTVTWTEVTDNI